MRTPSPNAPTPETRPAWEREATFHVEGLSCRSCARHAEGALAALEGIRKATVGFLAEAAQVVYDVRRTSEREIVEAMRRRGFRMWPAAGVSPSAQKGNDATRLGLVLALLGNLIAIALLAPRGEGPRDIYWVELGLSVLLLIVAGPPLAHRARALASRNVFGRELLALLGALGTLGIGLLALAACPTEGYLPPALLLELGFKPDGAALTAFEGAGAIAGFALLVRHAYAAVCRRAFVDVEARAEACARRARRLDGAGVEHPIAAGALGPGDRVRILEGERAPSDVLLETPARVADPEDAPARDRPAGEAISQGALVLSAEVFARVRRPAGTALSAAADAEVQRTVARIDQEVAHPGARLGWAHTAALSLSVAALSFASFALVVHSLVAGGPLNAPAWLSAIAVLLGFSSSAFTLALPGARIIAVLRARALGVVVKDPAALETLARVEVAVFDKTGTVTTGAIRVVGLRWFVPPDQAALEDVAGLEAGSSHPAGRAIAAYLAALGVVPRPPEERPVHRGDGISGRVRGALVEVCAAGREAALPAEVAFGASAVVFRRNGVALGCFELWDPPRSGAEAALRALWQRGVASRLMSGDRPEATAILAHRLGVPGQGGLSAAEKALLVRDLQHDGAAVLYVGDGLHDGAGQAQADLAVAVAPGTLPGAVNAPLLLIEDRLGALCDLVDLARALRAQVRQGVAISILYNAAVIPLAAAGFIGPLGAAALALGEALLLLANTARLLFAPRTTRPEAKAPGRALPALPSRSNATSAP
jgi:cation transport ATPase